MQGVFALVEGSELLVGEGAGFPTCDKSNVLLTRHAEQHYYRVITKTRE